MKTVINTTAVLLVFGGLMVMAGSAGDCDGKCMEQANTLGEMMTLVALGLGAVVSGAIILLSTSK